MTKHIQDFYDVVIVGGGIQGCAVAQAVQASGFTALLLEKNDWASATSSRSSKLIHGGLRYLQTGQFGLVRECLAEREWMLKAVPQLVKPNWFYLPIYRDSDYPAWQIHIGLWLYYALTGFAPQGRFRNVPKKEWQALCGLKTDGLRAVFAYQDAQADDRALTVAIKESAERYGATCLTQAAFLSAEKQNAGYAVTFECADRVETVSTQILVNASGPWVNRVLQHISPPPPQVEIDLIQGAHIVIEEKISDECFYLEAPSDHRAIFVLPWQGRTLIGTTETEFNGEPEQTVPLQSEIDYLLDTVRHYFPQQPLTLRESFSGLRVMQKSGLLAFMRSREVMIDVEEGLITIYGGKLTAWRSTGERVLREIEQQLGVGRYIDTRDLPLGQ
jgi:glycerol-3-phosphate dehydrogenase